MKFDSNKLSHALFAWAFSGIAIIAVPLWGSVMFGFIQGVLMPFKFLDWSKSCTRNDAEFCGYLDNFANIGVFIGSCLIVIFLVLVCYIFIRIFLKFLIGVIDYVNSRI